MPAVYEDEKVKPINKQGSHGDQGVNPEHREAEVVEPKNLNNAESTPEPGYGGNAEDKEQEKLDEKEGGWATNIKDGAKNKVRGKINSTKKKIKNILTVIAIATTIATGIIGFITAPGLIINHIRELILSKGHMQMQQFRKYKRMKMGKVKRMFTPNGRRANRLVAEMNRYGLKPNFDGGTLKGFTPIGGNYSTIGVGTVEEFENFLNKKHPFKSARWKTKQMNAVYKKLGVPRKSIISLSALDLDESADKILNKHMAENLFKDDEAKIKSDEVKASDGAESEDAIKEREAKNKLAKEIIDDDNVFDDIKKELKSGKNLDELTDYQRAALRIAMDELDDEMLSLLDQISKVGIKSKIINGAKAMASSVATEAVVGVCTLKRKLNAAVMAGRLYRSRSLVKYATIFVTASDQTRKGEVSAKLLNELMLRVVAPDNNGQFIGSSPAFMNLMGKKFNKSDNDDSRTFFSVDGKLTGKPKAISDAVDNIPGTSKGYCDVALNPFAQVGAGVAEGAIALIPGIGQAVKSGEMATAEAIKITIKQAIENAIKDTFSKKGLAMLAGNLALSFSVEMATTYVELQAQKMLMMPFTGQEKGAMLGHIISGGAGVMMRQRNLRSGMVPATTKQYAQAQQEYIAWKKEETKNMSLYARLFDYQNQDSVIFNLTSKVAFAPMTPYSIGLSFANVLSKTSRLLMANPVNLLTDAGNLASSTVNAESKDLIDYDSYTVKGKNIDLATDPAGNVLPIMLQSVQDIDTDNNIEDLVGSNQIDSDSLQPIEGSTFAKHIANCVDNVDSFSIIEENDFTDNPEFDCLATQSETKKYKAHLAYLDMMDGIDAWLFPNEIDPSSPGAQNQGIAATENNPGGMIIGDPYTETTSVACAPGTRDIGLQEAYVKGVMFRSRMCSVSNIPSYGQADNPGGQFSTPGADGHAIVNSRVSGAWYKLAEDAKAAGMNFTANSSFRSMAHQQSLFKGDTSKVARPGNSSHQGGVALDITQLWGDGSVKSGASCATKQTRNNEIYKWMEANASKYGFKQYAAEAWHWDALPAGNRC